MLVLCSRNARPGKDGKGSLTVLLKPRVARAQEIIRLHPLLCLVMDYDQMRGNSMCNFRKLVREDQLVNRR